MISHQVSKQVALARSTAVPRVLLAKPTLPSRNVVRRFKEDDKPSGGPNTKVSEGDPRIAVDNINHKATPEEFSQRSIQPSDVPTLPFAAAFTRRREVFTGRMAMLGFFAACYWEWYFPSHPNILQQVSAFTSRTGFELSEATVLSIIVAIVAWNTITALAPGSASYTRANQADVAKRPAGPNQQVPDTFGQAFGVTGIGFTKANELFNGRLAMIGFPAAIIAQMNMGGLDGPGLLAQVAQIFGKVPDAAWYGSVGSFFTLYVIGTLIVAYWGGKTGERHGGKDIY